jgi:hypothetical protein
MKHTELLGTEEIFYRSESPLTWFVLDIIVSHH